MEDVELQLSMCLEENPADLIVIDSFQDLFLGSDSNKNIEMRRTVGLYDRIAAKFDALVLLVHHVNKGGYSQNPNQSQVQGGSGFAQKVRCILDLRNKTDDHSTKYLSVTKGNYVPSERKRNAMVLSFDEHSFLYSDSGETISVEQISETQSQVLQVNWGDVFAGKTELQRKDIIEIVKEKYGGSESTVSRALKKAQEQKKIEWLKRGMYKYVDG